MRSAVKPAWPRMFERAMLKQPAWAAAMSSSGFVCGSFSNRDLNVYGVFFRTPLGPESVPLPSFREPFQTADAVRFMTISFALFGCCDSVRASQRLKRRNHHARRKDEEG